jgi:hypothetical protein
MGSIAGILLNTFRVGTSDRGNCGLGNCTLSSEGGGTGEK